MWIFDDPFQNLLFKLCYIVPGSKEKHVRMMGHFQFFPFNLCDQLQGDGELLIESFHMIA